MSRLAAGLFLLAHAGVTAGIWIPPQRGSELKSFGSQASWLFADVRPVVVAFAVVASVSLGVAGLAYLAHNDWWAPMAVLGAVVSFALIAATFTPWWSAAVVINAGIIYLAWDTAAGQLTGR